MSNEKRCTYVRYTSDVIGQLFNIEDYNTRKEQSNKEIYNLCQRNKKFFWLCIIVGALSHLSILKDNYAANSSIER